MWDSARCLEQSWSQSSGGGSTRQAWSTWQIPNQARCTQRDCSMMTNQSDKDGSHITSWWIPDTPPPTPVKARQPILSFPEGPHSTCTTLPREIQHFSSCNSNPTAALTYHPKQHQPHCKPASQRGASVHAQRGLTTLAHITLLLKNVLAGGSTDLSPHSGIGLLVFRGSVESWRSLCPCQSLKQSGSRGHSI